MILLSRLDRQEIALNCDLILSIEACPDTTVRLVGGDNYLVRESVSEVIERIRAFKSSVLRGAGLGAVVAGRPSPGALRSARNPGDEDVVVFERDCEAVIEVPA
jgi:uncharacterized protein YlzI (FlbEa/FlbD family)